MKLVMHIGSHKAGSTAIQKYATVFNKNLQDNGIVYPTDVFEDYPNQHSYLYRLLNQKDDEAVDKAFSSISGRAKEAGGNQVFLSGEDLSACDAPAVRMFGKHARSYFTNIEIVLVLRNKVQYLLSQYNHNLRHGPPLTVELFQKLVRFEPKAIIERWRNEFGPNKLKIVAYDHPAGSLLGGFLGDVFGLPLDGSDAQSLRGVNRSFDFLTALYINDVLKRSSNFDLAKVNQHYFKTFGSFKPRFPIEKDLALLLDSLYDDADWESGGLDSFGLLKKDVISIKEMDAESASKYSTYFTEFLTKYHSDLHA